MKYEIGETIKPRWLIVSTALGAGLAISVLLWCRAFVAQPDDEGWVTYAEPSDQAFRTSRSDATSTTSRDLRASLPLPAAPTSIVVDVVPALQPDLQERVDNEAKPEPKRTAIDTDSSDDLYSASGRVHLGRPVPMPTVGPQRP